MAMQTLSHIVDIYKISKINTKFTAADIYEEDETERNINYNKLLRVWDVAIYVYAKTTTCRIGR
jgi:hypothetical protein